jgi:hypothetical protein
VNRNRLIGKHWTPEAAPDWSALAAGQEWMREAACGGLWHIFDSATAAAQYDARRICAACPVRPECQAYAFRTRVDTGTWAGEWWGRHSSHGAD